MSLVFMNLLIPIAHSLILRSIVSSTLPCLDMEAIVPPVKNTNARASGVASPWINEHRCLYWLIRNSTGQGVQDTRVYLHIQYVNLLWTVAMLCRNFQRGCGSCVVSAWCTERTLNGNMANNQSIGLIPQTSVMLSTVISACDLGWSWAHKLVY